MTWGQPHLDGSDGEGDLPPTIDVRVENTKNVLELLRDDQRLKRQIVYIGKQMKCNTVVKVTVRGNIQNVQ